MLITVAMEHLRPLSNDILAIGSFMDHDFGFSSSVTSDLEASQAVDVGLRHFFKQGRLKPYWLWRLDRGNHKPSSKRFV